jgi:uncharacterized protein with PhoU and TrkA domain
MRDKLRKIEYEPISVRKLLVEMKNLSELMIDLAYSAVLFNDRELGEEVLELEERVDYLSYLLLMNASLAVRDKDDAEQVAGIMKAASSANKISDAAADIAGVTLRNIGIPRVLCLAFSKANEVVGRATVQTRSVLARKTLAQLNLEEEIGCDIIAIERNGAWRIHPEDSWRLERGDHIIARGDDESVRRLRELAAGECKKTA